MPEVLEVTIEQDELIQNQLEHDTVDEQGFELILNEQANQIVAQQERLEQRAKFESDLKNLDDAMAQEQFDQTQWKEILSSEGRTEDSRLSRSTDSPEWKYTDSEGQEISLTRLLTAHSDAEALNRHEQILFGLYSLGFASVEYHDATTQSLIKEFYFADAKGHISYKIFSRPETKPTEVSGADKPGEPVIDQDALIDRVWESENLIDEETPLTQEETFNLFATEDKAAEPITINLTDNLLAQTAFLKVWEKEDPTIAANDRFEQHSPSIIIEPSNFPDSSEAIAPGPIEENAVSTGIGIEQVLEVVEMDQPPQLELNTAADQNIESKPDAWLKNEVQTKQATLLEPEAEAEKADLDVYQISPERESFSHNGEIIIEKAPEASQRIRVEPGEVVKIDEVQAVAEQKVIESPIPPEIARVDAKQETPEVVPLEYTEQKGRITASAEVQAIEIMTVGANVESEISFDQTEKFDQEYAATEAKPFDVAQGQTLEAPTETAIDHPEETIIEQPQAQVEEIAAIELVKAGQEEEKQGRITFIEHKITQTGEGKENIVLKAELEPEVIDEAQQIEIAEPITIEAEPTITEQKINQPETVVAAPTEDSANNSSEPISIGAYMELANIELADKPTREAVPQYNRVEATESEVAAEIIETTPSLYNRGETLANHNSNNYGVDIALEKTETSSLPDSGISLAPVRNAQIELAA